MKVTLGKVFKFAVGVNDTDIRNALKIHASGYYCVFPSLGESLKGLVDDLRGGKGAAIVSRHADRNGRGFKIVTYVARGETWVESE